MTTESPLEHMHDARLAGIGHRPQLNRVPGGFSNFSVGYATALAHSAYFNLDWITLVVMAIVALVGLAVFLLGKPDRSVRTHLHDEAEPTGAERHGPAKPAAM